MRKMGLSNYMKTNFLQQNNYEHWEVISLPSDASKRCYYRLKKDGETRLLMDSSQEKKSFKNYIHVANYLQSYDLTVPKIYVQNKEKGLAVIEDFGMESFTKLLNKNILIEEKLYSSAIDALIHLHKQSTKNIVLPCYDVEKLVAETQIFTDYFAPYKGVKLNKNTTLEYQKIWTDILAPITKKNENFFILRDYHVDNIIWLSAKNNSAKKCGLLDFQDSVLGMRVYDIVSLLQDARRDISKDLEQKMLAQYFAAFPDIDRAKFMQDYFIIGAQRHCKVLGIFARLNVRDGKSIYLKHLPRVWNYLKYCIDSEPKLLRLQNWLEVNFEN